MSQSSQPVDRRQVIRQFYEQQIEEQGYFIDGFVDFMPDKRIGRVELLITGDWGEYGCEGDFDSVEIEEIKGVQQTVPQSIIEAFDRHVWFSQHSLTNIFAFKIPVEEEDTYVIGISGMAGDGYDNCCTFIEIFNESGTFAGATSIGEDEKPTWWDRPIDGNDFNGGAPKWSEYPALAMEDHKRWSEKMAVSSEQDGNITRLVMFTQESVQNM
jgi:hypothetical protein